MKINILQENNATGLNAQSVKGGCMKTTKFNSNPAFDMDIRTV
jgi:hypothetical protein